MEKSFEGRSGTPEDIPASCRSEMKIQAGKGVPFLAFEGIDGSGKTTQLRRLQKHLSRKGIKCRLTREPTDSPIGSLIHQIMTGRLHADNRVIAALFAADRIDHLLNETDGIIHTLESGTAVVTDRYYFSSYAYHGVDLDMDWVISANSVSAEILRPSMTVFLDVPVETALERISKNRFGTELFECEERLRAVRAKYYEAFEKLRDQERVMIIDAGADEETVERRVWDAVSYLFNGEVVVE